MDNRVNFLKLFIKKIIVITFIFLINNTCVGGQCDSFVGQQLVFQLAQQALSNQLGFNINITEQQAILTTQSNQIRENETIISDNLFIVHRNQEETTKGQRITKFENQGFNFGGFDSITGHIEDGTENINAGLDTILDASIEIADSLVGARSLLKKAFKVFKQYKKIKNPDKEIKTLIIELPGAYKIPEDITGGIIIDSSNVIIDLNGHTLQGHCRTPIIITSGKTNIRIKNGTIMGGEDLITAPSGILINKNCRAITIQDVTIMLCHSAITFHGLENNFIEKCKVQNCIFEKNKNPLYLQYTKDILFKACKLQDCLDKKAIIKTSESYAFDNCKGFENPYK